MSPAEEDRLLRRLEEVAAAEKTFDAAENWVALTDKSSSVLQYRVSLRIDGVLQGDVSLRLTTPLRAWEEDVYGQIGVGIPGSKTELRLNPVEWRPRRKHSNPASANPPLDLLTLSDRWHPFEHNKVLGIKVFRQDQPGIAAPLPRAISSFTDYIDLCAELWNCPDTTRIPAPPWSRDLFLTAQS